MKFDRKRRITATIARHGPGVSRNPFIPAADQGNGRIRKVSTDEGFVSTLAGSQYGFVDTTLPGEDASTVYTGPALGYTDTDVAAGSSYTYTLTANGPGTVSNTIAS